MVNKNMLCYKGLLTNLRMHFCGVKNSTNMRSECEAQIIWPTLLSPSIQLQLLVRPTLFHFIFGKKTFELHFALQI